MRELVGIIEPDQMPRRIHRNTSFARQMKEAWKKSAEEIYRARSKEFDENVGVVERIFEKNFYWWARLDGALAIIGSFFERVLAKVIVDYTGCLHFRHPYVGERASRSRSKTSSLLLHSSLRFSFVYLILFVTQQQVRIGRLGFQREHGLGTSIPVRRAAVLRGRGNNKQRNTFDGVNSQRRSVVASELRVLLHNRSQLPEHLLWDQDIASQYSCDLFMESDEDSAKFPSCLQEQE